MVPALASLQDLELRLLHWINCEGESPLNDTIANFANDPLFGVPVFILLFLAVALTAAGRVRGRAPATHSCLVVTAGVTSAVWWSRRA